MAILRGLIFDVDGTLAETEEFHRIAFNDTFAQFNLNWTWDRDLYLDLLRVTGGKERILHYQRSYLHEPEMSVERVKELHEYKSQRYDQYVSQGRVTLRPGIERIIYEALSQDIALAIATTTSLSNVECLLRSTLGDQSLGYFRVIAAGDMVSNKKPSPEIYDLALSLLDMAPDEVVAIEDSRNGLVSALGANIITVITLSEFSLDLNMDGAIAVVDCLGDTQCPSSLIQGRDQNLKILDLDWFRSLVE